MSKDNTLEVGRFRLSFAEENIYYTQLNIGESPVFNIGGYLNLVGEWDQTRIECSLRELINETVAFSVQLALDKTTGDIYKHLSSNKSCAIEVWDLAHHADPENEADSLLKREMSKHISFLSRQYFYFYIIKISQRYCRVAIRSHHLFMDGNSLQILIQKFLSIYGGANRGEASSADKEMVVIKEFLAREESYLKTRAYAADSKYWLTQFQSKDYSSVQGGQHLQGAICSRFRSALAAKEVARLREYAETQGCSVQDLVISLLSVSYYRLYSKSDISIGIFLHNRSRNYIKSSVGLFSSILPCRLALESDFTCKDVISKVSRQIRNNYKHRRFPITHLNRQLQTLGRHPVPFDFVIGVELFPTLDQLPEFVAEIGLLYPEVSEFPLAIRYRSFLGTGVNEIDLIYDNSCYTKPELDALIRYFRQAISDSDFSERIGSLSFLKTELDSIVAGGVSSRCSEKHHVYSQVEWMSEQYPDRLAVVCGNGTLTYLELNRKANKIASYLISKGIDADDIVGVCCNRSLDSVICILGILKSGGCYLPLDPAYPPDRLEHMVRDSAVSCILAHRNSRLMGLENADAKILYIDDLESSAALDFCTEENPGVEISRSDLAYLIYTSGSTGLPKGVMIEHGGVLNFLASMAERPGIKNDDVLLSVTSLSFDIHVLEFLLPLFCGATVVVATDQEYHSPNALVNLIDRYDVTVMQATPSTWKLLLESDWHPRKSLKALCGGERLDEPLRLQFLSRKKIELWNMFGPTETTVWSLVEPVASVAYIGLPIDNTWCLILNANGQIVPRGVRGELFIGGDGLARGYWNRPDLTKERFLDYVNGNIRLRLYRTGDIVRQDDNGKLLYIGRSDSQIKLGGIRIEPGEIEDQILKVPGIRSAAVVERSSRSGDKKLVAFIEPDNNAVSDSFDDIYLKKLLAKILPNHMIPSDFVLLERLPQTPNNKIDRVSLKNIKFECYRSKKSGRSPRTDLEKEIAAVWSSVLEISLEDIFLESNLLSLGADSLQIMTALILSERKGLYIRMESLFSGMSLQEIVAGALPQRPPADYMLADMVYSCALLADQKGVLTEKNGDKPFCINSIFDIEYMVSDVRLREAFKKVLGRHTSLRLKFLKHQGDWNIEILSALEDNVLVDFVSLQSRWEESHSVVEETFSQMYARLNIQAAKHLAIRVITDVGNRTKVFITVSHLICDQFSQHILLQDLLDAYFSTDREVQRDDNDREYVFVANELYRQANSEQYLSQIKYWESLPWSEIRSLPLDFPGNNTKELNTNETSEIYFTQLDESQTAELIKLVSDKLKIGVRDYLVSCLASYCQARNGSEYQYIFAHDHGRKHGLDRLDQLMSGMVGSFATFKCFFLKVANASCREVYHKKMHDQIESVPYSGLGFHQLRNLCRNQAVRDAIGRFPGPDIWLNYVGIRSESVIEHRFPVRMSDLMDKAEFVHLDPSFPRARLFMLPWDIKANRLRMFWEYSSALHLPSSVMSLAEGFKCYLIEDLELLKRGK